MIIDKQSACMWTRERFIEIIRSIIDLVSKRERFFSHERDDAIRYNFLLLFDLSEKCLFSLALLLALTEINSTSYFLNYFSPSPVFCFIFMPQMYRRLP